MVRHARFAFDDESQQPLPDDPDGFTEEDDRMLEDYFSSSRSKPSPKREPQRHLADADWMDPDKKQQRSTGRKRSA